jgi:hypothetical protein
MCIYIYYIYYIIHIPRIDHPTISPVYPTKSGYGNLPSLRLLPTARATAHGALRRAHPSREAGLGNFEEKHGHNLSDNG